MTPQDLLEAFVAPKSGAQRFESWLRLWLPVSCALSVTYTNNRSTMLSYRRSARHIDLRLHKAFAQAGPDVAQAVCAYVEGHKGATAHRAALQAFVRQCQKVAPQPTRNPQSLRAQGAVHDLQPMFAKLNQEQFDNRCTAAITWGRSAPPSVRRRSITLGSYNVGQNLIRIHPCLDQTFVPEYVVLGVMHHEMLHEILGIDESRGRRSIHPPEFVAIERMYQDYDRCTAWERAHIGRLLAYRPKAVGPSPR